MNILKGFILLFSFLTVTGCVTNGPKIVIETNVPAEDFVVLCKKTKSHLFAIGENVREIVVDKVIVTKSGVEVDCGIMLGGSNGYVSVSHPVHIIEQEKTYTKDGVEHIVMNKTKLDLLDEQKAKFEAGYWDNLPAPGWDKDKTPAQRYARTIGGCGLDYQYLDYYNQVKRVDKDYFKKKYNNFLIECNSNAYSEIIKSDPTLENKVLGFKKRMKLIWKPEKWSKYE